MIVAGAGRRGLFTYNYQIDSQTGKVPGVVGFCSVMVEVSSYSGSYGPSSGRAGRFVCYSHVHH
jgi:hypothetical protein